MQPSVIVLDSPKEPGLGALDGPGTAQVTNKIPLPLDEALARSWETDAHLACYQTPEPSWPRLNKEVLQHLPPDTVTVSVTCLDWDTPGHKVLSAADRAHFEQALEAAPSLLTPSYHYLTKHGARLIYVHGPVDPFDAEALHRGLVELWAREGLVLDAQVWEWNRIHRLPKVVRDGHPTKHVVRGDGSPLSHHQVPRVAQRRALSAPTLRLPQPDITEAEALLWRPKQTGNGVKLTAWGLEAKRRLKGRADGALDELFDPYPPPVPDPRNATLMTWIGVAASLLHSCAPGTTPEHLYALFAPPAQQSLRANDRDLLAETWKMILYCWAKEDARHAAEEQAYKDLAHFLLDQDQIPFGTEEELLKHVVVKPARGTYYVLQADGYYTGPVGRIDLLPCLRDSGLAPDLVSLTRTTSHGTRDMTPEEVMSTYGTLLHGGLHKTPGPPGRGWVVPGPSSALMVGSYRRNPDLSPFWDEEVDHWLRLLAGDRHEDLCRWIGLALAFERGPICALSISGPAGTGKKLLVKGLAEAIDPPGTCQAEAFGSWQYGLEDSPFVIVNEGWPRTSEPLDVTFRKLVTGDTFTVRTKFAADRTVEICPRVIITANKPAVVARLFGKENETHDHEAVALRLFHFEADERAARFFQTQDPDYCEGWISGRSAEKSTFKVARHFLALYRKHKDDEGGTRLLMENMTEPRLIRRMTTVEGLPSQVAEALAELFSRGALRKGLNSGWPYVTVGQVVDHLEMEKQLKAPSRVWVGRLLAPYRPEGADKQWFRTPQGGREMGHPLDVRKLQELASDLEYSTPQERARREEEL